MTDIINNYKGFKIKIKPCDNCESPNDWSDENIFLVYDHRQFDIKRKGFDPSDINEWLNITKSLEKPNLTSDEIEELKGEYQNYADYSKYHIFAVYAYIHSGVSLSLGNNVYPFNTTWDTSMNGFVLASKEEFENIKDANKIATNLIETWNQYLSGEVYEYYVIKEKKCIDCGHTDEIQMDQCREYYGDPETSGCIEDAKNFINSYIKKSNEYVQLTINFDYK